MKLSHPFSGLLTPGHNQGAGQFLSVDRQNGETTQKDPAAIGYSRMLLLTMIFIMGALPDLCLTLLHHEPAILLQLTPSTNSQGHPVFYTLLAVGIFFLLFDHPTYLRKFSFAQVSQIKFHLKKPLWKINQ
jgi:hypothetical protein